MKAEGKNYTFIDKNGKKLNNRSWCSYFGGLPYDIHSPEDIEAMMEMPFFFAQDAESSRWMLLKMDDGQPLSDEHLLRGIHDNA